MTLHRHAAARDLNEAGIVSQLRAIPGVHVELLDRPCDAIVLYRGVVYLMEFKGRKAKLTPTQTRFHIEWAGSVHIVRTFTDAMAVLRIFPEPPHSHDCGGGGAREIPPPPQGPPPVEVRKGGGDRAA